MAEPTLARKGSTIKERQQFFERERQRAAAAEKRREMWDRLSRFIHNGNGAWLVSAPHDPLLRIEVREGSEVVDRLFDAGFDVIAAGTNTRIEGGKFLPVRVYEFQIPLPR